MAVPPPDPSKPRTEETGTFGKVAIKLGYITPAQLEEATKVQGAAAKAGLRKRLGDILIKKGYLTTDQLTKILKKQTVVRKVGEYELMSKLGEGGMGSVYKAKQLSMDRVIALKILAPKLAKNKEFHERFVREARAVAKLNHPHIVSGIDVGEADGFCYFAMEYVDGDSLGQYMNRLGGKLPEDKALEFVRQTALALHHAHGNNILHRDVKPDNVLLDKPCRVAKLVDLGLARSAAVGEEDSALTQAGQAVGTPFYISPEQARGRSDLSPATDLYSLGGTLYHLLTGQVPFDGPTAASIMTRHITDPVPSPRAANSAVSLGADRIVMKLMQKDPADRYKDALQLVKDIERVQQGDMLDKPPGATSARKAKPAKAAASTSPARQREEKEPSAADSGPTIPTRAFRRRRRQQAAGGLSLAALLIALLGALLFLLVRGGKTNLVNPVPPPQQPAPGPETPKAPPTPVVEHPPPAAPAALKAEAGGRRVFKADFEGKLESFEVDPLIEKLGHYATIVSDTAGQNHVLRLALIRQPYRSVPAEKEAGVMARLLLAPNISFSPDATLTVKAFFGQCTDPSPELRVYWDHKVEGSPRALSAWSFRDPAFRTGWVKVQLQLGKAPVRLKSPQLPDAPQYISFTAGNPEEKIEVYLDDLELVDGVPPAESPPATTHEPKAKTGAEPPVAPPPGKKAETPGKEAPAVPAPRKTGPDDKGAGALHQAI